MKLLQQMYSKYRGSYCLIEASFLSLVFHVCARISGDHVARHALSCRGGVAGKASIHKMPPMRKKFGHPRSSKGPATFDRSQSS